MNFIEPEYSTCTNCKKVFKTRGLGIHQVACLGKRKNKGWWREDTPVRDFIAVRFGKPFITNQHEVELSTIIYDVLDTHAVYELTYNDRTLLGIFSGYIVRPDDNRVMVELSLDSEKTHAWWAIRPWHQADVKIIFAPT